MPRPRSRLPETCYDTLVFDGAQLAFFIIAMRSRRIFLVDFAIGASILDLANSSQDALRSQAAVESNWPPLSGLTGIYLRELYYLLIVARDNSLAVVAARHSSPPTLIQI